MKRIIPHFLLWSRLALAPLVLLCVWLDAPRGWYIAILFYGIISDVYDGVLARRWQVATEFIRRADSNVDTVFYISVIVAAVLRHKALFAAVLLPIGWVVGIKLARYLFDFIKYRRETAYHMWSAKAWNITLFLALCEIFWTGAIGFSFWAVIILGIWNNVEGLLASIILPTWTHDVPTLWHAWRDRKV